MRTPVTLSVGRAGSAVLQKSDVDRRTGYSHGTLHSRAQSNGTALSQWCDTVDLLKPYTTVSLRSRDQHGPSAAALYRFADQADLLDDPTVHRLVATAAATTSAHLRRRIGTVLTVKATQNHRQPFDDSIPGASPLADRLRLGTTITGSAYTLEQDDLTRHLLAVGQSGAGKTTLFYNLMDQLSVLFLAGSENS